MLYNEYYKEVDETEFKFYEYQFDNLFELIKFIDNNKPYPQWGNKLASEKKDYGFSGTESIEEAKDLCLNANSSGINDFILYYNQLQLHQNLTKSQKRNFKNDVYGSRINISKALTGNPRSMQKLIRNEPLKHITLWVNCACRCRTTRKAINNRGIIISNMIKLLEDNGYRVNLNFFDLSGRNNEVLYIKVNIKNPGEKLDLSSTYFPMCHPSFLRRIIFAVQERTNCDASWREGYGHTINDVEYFIDVKKGDIVIGEPEKIRVFGENLIDDTLSFFEHINFLKFIAPGKKAVYKENMGKIIFVDEEDKGYSKKCNLF